MLYVERGSGIPNIRKAVRQLMLGFQWVQLTAPLITSLSPQIRTALKLPQTIQTPDLSHLEHPCTLLWPHFEGEIERVEML